MLQKKRLDKDEMFVEIEKPEAVIGKVPSWWNWLYHFMDTSILFDPGRLFINAQNPEQYLYYYNSSAETAAI